IILIYGAINLVAAILVQILFSQIASGKLEEGVSEQVARIGKNERWVATGYLAVIGIVFLAVGIWTRSAGASFVQIVATRGRDINHLMEGFKTLNKMYSLIATALLAAILAGLVFIIVQASIT